MSHLPRDLSGNGRAILGSFSPNQNRAILIVALACACVSLMATLITLRWFISMKRLFRHHLVLLLIASDTVKALSYFIFPIVVFARGPVRSSSKWCQASGFFLALSIEASDFAILLIALHAVLYIFRPPIRFGDGGLYPYRKWLPAAWLVFPLLAASLAFVNARDAYVTSGTFCYLPQRPFWYRLALAWIPRYLILITILAMYAAISIYVRIKFRSFKNLERSESASGFQSVHRTSVAESAHSGSPRSPGSPAERVVPPVPSGRLSPLPEEQSPRMLPTIPAPPESSTPPHHEPWDSLAFITSTPLAGTTRLPEGVAATDFAPASNATPPLSLWPPRARFGESGAGEQRTPSEVPTVHTTGTEDSVTTSSQVDSTIDDPRDKIITDPLKRTRMAIRQQLRFLFIYPAVYVLMWAFPFANHCLLYSDTLARRPIFWLQILTTCSLSLQAAANCTIFSFREKPWRRIDEGSKLSLLFWRRRGIHLVRTMQQGGRPAADGISERRTTTDTDMTLTNEAPPTASRGPTWWEAEGKKRKDSVWLGTDLMTPINSRDSSTPPSTPSHEPDDEIRPGPT